MTHFGCNFGLFGRVNEQKSSVIVAICSYRVVCNDPEALGLAFYHQGPTFIKLYC